VRVDRKKVSIGKAKRGTRRDRVEGFFMSLPIDIFAEVRGFSSMPVLDYLIEVIPQIVSHSYPGDLLALARTNKSFRFILMRRSAVNMWRRAEGNLSYMGFPRCPPHMIEPSYAALLFTKNCTVC
jgi:hypothetical protein